MRLIIITDACVTNCVFYNTSVSCSKNDALACLFNINQCSVSLLLIIAYYHTMACCGERSFSATLLVRQLPMPWHGQDTLSVESTCHCQRPCYLRQHQNMIIIVILMEEPSMKMSMTTHSSLSYNVLVPMLLGAVKLIYIGHQEEKSTAL